MASILRCDEIGDGRTCQDDIKGKATAVRRWRVQTDGAMGPITVINSALSASPDPIVALGVGHPEASTLLFSKQRSCQSDGGDESGNKFYIVQIDYDNQFDQDPNDYQENPLDRAVKWSLDWAQFTRVITKDEDGDPVVNTVGDEFEEPVEQDDSRPIIVAIRNEDAAGFESIVALALDYKDAVNSDTFKGVPAGFVKLGPIQTGEIQYENGQAFYSVRYEFHLHEEPAPDIEGWDRQFLNIGNNAYSTADTASSKYSLGSESPKKLLENGTPAGPSDDPYYVTFQTYRRRPFGALNL